MVMLSASSASSTASEVPLPTPVNAKRPFRHVWRLALLALVVFLGYEVSRRLFGWNFHTVIPGRVYRGAQPTPGLIETLAKDYGVRTIINLRGCGLPADWYAKETRSVQQLGIAQEDICFSALRLPSSLELRRLLEVLDRTEYPVYFHCRRGADRTGMAAVIVMLLEPGVTLPESRKQLGLWYAHVALGKPGVLDRFFDLYEEWLKQHGRTHDAAAFRHWVLEEYKGGWCSARFEEFTPLQSEARTGEPLGYRVRVRNTSGRAWQFRAGSQFGNHLAYQIWDGEKTLAEGRAGMFEREVPAGESVTLTLVVRPLPRAGRFRLLADMVEEQHCWFYQAGSEPHEEELVIRE
jgi:hypothetical protein